MSHLPRVLVIEDDEAIREILRTALADEGYEVIVARHGQSALMHMQRWTPDLIVLDIMMPVMDGITFRQRQRELVRDHLRRRADRAEERVLVRRRPSRDRDAVHAERCDGEDDENADMEKD